MAERLAVVQRGEAERVAAQHLADGADIWRDGATIDTLLDADGNLDTDAVIELAKATAAAHPHWVRRALPPVKRGSLVSGASSPSDRLQPSWASVLRGDR